MVHLVLLAVGLGLLFASLAFVAGGVGPTSWSTALRWSLAAAVVAIASAALFVVAEVVPGDGDLLNGTLQWLGLEAWAISVLLELGAVIVVVIAVARRQGRDAMVPTALIVLALLATWHRALLAGPFSLT